MFLIQVGNESGEGADLNQIFQVETQEEAHAAVKLINDWFNYERRAQWWWPQSIPKFDPTDFTR